MLSMSSSSSNNRMEITGISIERFSEGKVVEAWDSFDALGMMQQLGHIPSPEQQAQAYGGACNTPIERSQSRSLMAPALFMPLCFREYAF